MAVIVTVPPPCQPIPIDSSQCWGLPAQVAHPAIGAILRSLGLPTQRTSSHKQGTYSQEQRDVTQPKTLFRADFVKVCHLKFALN